jgi:hypothetical protein
MLDSQRHLSCSRYRNHVPGWAPGSYSGYVIHLLAKKLQMASPNSEGDKKIQQYKHGMSRDAMVNQQIGVYRSGKNQAKQGQLWYAVATDCSQLS